MFWQLKLNHKQGLKAEKKALDYLLANKLELVYKNYSTRLGELDLIMLDQGDLVFIEVRYRKSNSYVNAGESITAKKKQRIQITAQHFLQNNPSYQQHYCRFDAVLIKSSSDEISLKDATIQWLKGIF